MGQRLHIVHFDIAYPPDYGGAMAEYFLLKALSEAGAEIDLHCFQYGDRQKNDKLQKWAREVYYYPRKNNPLLLLSSTPYIVNSRKNRKLFNRLLNNDFPILFDGLQSSAYIVHPLLNLRRKILRLHNIEWKYYQELNQLESSPLKSLYYKLESGKLREYEEAACRKADQIVCMATHDFEYYRNQYLNVTYVPPAHPNEEVVSPTGKGHYILYHGNLSIRDNEKAAIFLCEEVFSKLTAPCKIAGKAPSRKLRNVCSQTASVELIANPSQELITDLIKHAHVNVLYSHQGSGIKMKLLHALYAGRFCVVNKEILSGSGLDRLCHRAEKAENMIQIIQRLMEKTFDENALQRRKDGLHNYQNTYTAKQLLELAK